MLTVSWPQWNVLAMNFRDRFQADPPPVLFLFPFTVLCWSSACAHSVKEREVIVLHFDLFSFINFYILCFSIWECSFFSIWEYTEAASQASCDPFTFYIQENRDVGMEMCWPQSPQGYIILYLVFSTLLVINSKCWTLFSDITLKGLSFCQCLLRVYFILECSRWLFVSELDCM